MPKKTLVYLLTETTGEYDSVERYTLAAVTSRKIAEAWPQTGAPYTQRDGFRDVETLTLDQLEARLAQEIKDYNDPRKNPLCVCGHRLSHHAKRGFKKCLHNTHPSYVGDSPHVCPGFRLGNLPISRKRR